MNAARRHEAGRWGPWVLGLVVLLGSVGLGPAAFAEDPVPDVPEAPGLPEPPSPPSPPSGTTALAGSFKVEKGEVHKGNAYLITPSVRIDGTLDGDLFAVAASAAIPGTVKGDVGFVGKSFDMTGQVEDAARVWAADVRVDGLVDGELIASGGRVVLGPKSVIRGDAGLYASEIVVEGTVEGDLTAAGGVVRFSGKVLRDASVTCDSFDVKPGARIEGDLAYSARKKVDVARLTPVVGGEVRFEEGVEKDIHAELDHAREMREKAHRIREEHGSSGFGTRIFLFFAALVVGLLALRTFRGAAPTVVGYIGADPLKSLGVGFLTVLSAIAALFAVILIITIPLVLIYWLLLLIAFYLGKIPVAVWLGRWGLAKVGRPTSSDAWALVVGLLAFYVIFAIPLVGTWIWFLVSLLGLGAIILGARDHRIARRTPVTPPAPSPPSPPAPEPPPAIPAD